MKQVLEKQSIRTDDRAQALAEFVVVIPIVFLMFSVMLQYFHITQVSQVGNYAAYVAARVYAVRGHDSKDDREDYSLAAACIAYAPVSKLEEHEWYTKLTEEFDELTSGAGGFVEQIVSMAKGFGVAWGVRLNALGGGSVKYEESGSGDLKQVKVELHYAYPIALPGVAELWTLTGGEKDITKSFEGGPEPIAISTLNSPYPYIDIVTKCAMGLEPWSGTPRERNSVDAEEAQDPSLEEKQKEMEDAKEKLDEASDKLAKEAKEKDEAWADYQQVKNDSSSTQAEIDAAYDDYLEELGDYNDAKDEYDAAKQEFEDTTGYDFKDD